MPRREPKPAPDFAVNFMADWRTVVDVDNPPAIAQGWTLHGTVRKHGKTYALAWRKGMTSACDERGNAHFADRDRAFRLIVTGVGGVVARGV